MSKAVIHYGVKHAADNRCGQCDSRETFGLPRMQLTCPVKSKYGLFTVASQPCNFIRGKGSNNPERPTMQSEPLLLVQFAVGVRREEVELSKP